MPTKIQALTKELEDTQEALRRSRNLRTSLTSQINSPFTSSIEERALKLRNMVFIYSSHHVDSWVKFKDENEKEMWMEKYIDIVS